MKKLLILAIATLVGSSTFAQTESASGTTPRPLKIGLKAGVNLPKYSYGNEDVENFETGATTNFHITGFLDAPLSKAFSIQPGISLQGKGAKFSEFEIAGSEDYEVKQNTLWLEVPVNVVGKVPLGPAANFYLGAGPYLAFGLSGKNDIDGPGIDDGGENPWQGAEDFTFGNKAENDLKGLDFGVNFSAGFQMNQGIMVGAGYGLGLTDLRPTGEGDAGKITNRVLSFSVGFAF